MRYPTASGTMTGSPRPIGRAARSADNVHSNRLDASNLVADSNSDRNHVTASACLVWRAHVSLRPPRWSVMSTVVHV
ncbi:MAG: hypothetical protein F4Y25_12985 [Chloroflexi bacterium]|nr:hypothetical protein [Chloroflexota bacterium]